MLVSYSFTKGGAAKAAARFLSVAKALRLPSVTVDCLSQDGYHSIIHWFKRVLSYALGALHFDGNPIKHSLGLFSLPSLSKSILNEDAVFHFHWINNDTLSVYLMRHLPAGSVVTLHDEWLYCGSEHYYDVNRVRLDFVEGYSFFAWRYLGFNLGYFVWRAKVRALAARKDLIFTVPSRWLLERAQASVVLRSCNVYLLPNPIDTDVFSRAPSDSVSAFRNSLGLQADDFVLAFGAVGGKSPFIKGGHFLDEALRLLSSQLFQAGLKLPKVLVFGGKAEMEKKLGMLDVLNVGHIHSQAKLSLLYSSVDCLVVPSLAEAFGQVAAESLACETPVVCFSGTGMSDIVMHGVNGLLADHSSVTDLACKISQMICMGVEQRRAFGARGRQHILSEFSYPAVGAIYKKIIAEAFAIRLDCSQN